MSDEKNIMPSQQGNASVIFEEKTIIEYMDAMGLTSKLNDNQKKQFMQIASAFKLNPFKREIHVSVYGDNFSVIIGYEEFIKRAERSKQLDGWSVRTEGDVNLSDFRKSNLKAIFECHRKDRRHAFTWEVDYLEYVQTTKEYVDGKPTGKMRPNKFWQEKPKHMIKKVAIAQGFRLCFSDELGGMPYTEEELTRDVGHEDVTDKMPPLTDKQKDQLKTEGDASKAVNDDMTSEQKEKITELLKSQYIAQNERKSCTDKMAGYSNKKADEIIAYLEEEIMSRKAVEEKQMKEAEENKSKENNMQV